MVSQRDIQSVYDTLKIIAVPSVLLRKADQPNGHDMGTVYSRGLIILFA